jgi:hypothetical protein
MTTLVVVVMLMVVWKRSVVSKLWAGHYSFKLGVVDRRPLFGGGRKDKFDFTVEQKLHH